MTRYGERAQQPEVIGKVTGHHGVQGWLKVFSYTRPPERILEYRKWLLGANAKRGDWQEFSLLNGRHQGRRILAKFPGVDNREAAEQLVGRVIAVDRSQLESLPEGEFYWSELIGLSVFNTEGVELGKVDHLLETGANDVLVVRQPMAGDQPKERLIPWGDDVVTRVDLEQARIEVNWDPDF